MRRKQLQRRAHKELSTALLTEGEGRTNLNATLKNGDPLPLWLSFLPSQRAFLVNNSEKDSTEEIEITLTAKNINTKIEDTFTLIVEDPVLKAKKLEKEKLEKERLLAEKRKEEELIKLEQEKILQAQKEKEEAELLAKKRDERFKLLANLEGADFNALVDINKQAEDIKLLRENIDKMFAKLDLETRSVLVKKIIKDLAEKSNNINYSNKSSGRDSVSFISPDYDIENQRIILEKLSNYVNKEKN